MTENQIQNSQLTPKGHHLSHRKDATTRRRLPVGAEVVPGGGVHFRVWAPRSQSVSVELSSAQKSLAARGLVPLEPEGGGYFSGRLSDLGAGALYRYRLDHGSFPDPASRFQPDGPHGSSSVVDPSSFRWTDEGWPGVQRDSQIIYELHIGTFTPGRTWRAAREKIPHLAELGITIIELMPVADFPGRFGWGYDGVDLFAPTRLYGEPDDFRAFVDSAHRAGIGVILDVVYNHLGPDGNYLKEFSPDYFTDRYANEWGQAINFDGESSGPVREFFAANAGYWIDEYHLDGLRLDATQQIFDSSASHILSEIVRQVRTSAKNRGTLVVAENEPQHTLLVRPVSDGGYGIDALWNDDFHHSAKVALTGRAEAYYSDYTGAPQEFVSAAKWGYLFQGQRYKWQKKRRGRPALDLPAWNFVNYLENHDQIANTLRGLRLHAVSSPGTLRAMTTVLLLCPASAMLFQGQEFAASAQFHYFADHNAELANLVAKGRKEFLAQFKTVSSPECERFLPDPSSEETFRRSTLDFSERERHAEAFALHRDLIRLRREDPVFRRPRAHGVDGAVLSAQAFVLRFFGGNEGPDRLLVVNFGVDLNLEPAPEPLLAPVENHRWKVLWSSEDPGYGGCGTPPLETEEGWWIPGQTAVVLIPQKLSDSRDGNDHPQNRPGIREG